MLRAYKIYNSIVRGLFKNYMFKTILTLVLLINVLYCRSITLPENNFIQGWYKSEYQLTFYKNDLYGYIDGGAELFLEFGFDSLLVQDYSNGKADLSLEVYCMENPEAALGIYLTKCGQETPNDVIQARNSTNKYQSLVVKNNFYIQLNNFKGNAIAERAIPEMLNKVLRKIPDSGPIKLLSILPEENKISNSEKIIRGPYALQPIYTFGEGDILKLEGKIFGMSANYKSGENKQYTQIIVPYPDSTWAKEVFNYLVENLDQYLTILEKNDFGFIFKDYQKKYGKVKLESNRLNILINLSEKPSL